MNWCFLVFTWAGGIFMAALAACACVFLWSCVFEAILKTLRMHWYFVEYIWNRKEFKVWLKERREKKLAARPHRSADAAATEVHDATGR